MNVVNKVSQFFPCNIRNPCVLSHFSHVRPHCNPMDVAARQAPLFWDSPGKNTGVGSCAPV